MEIVDRRGARIDGFVPSGVQQRTRRQMSMTRQDRRFASKCGDNQATGDGRKRSI